MNRNAESHFAQLPHADVQRSRFDRSHSVKFTGNIGQVIPFLCDPVLPGDTWDITTSKIIRLQTMVAPVMDSLFADIYYFFVPNRLIWNHWKEFCGENTQTSWYPTTQYTIPKIVIPNTGVAVGSIMDYLGIPPLGANQSPSLNGCSVNALRLRGYLLICNEWFRDQNLENDLNLQFGDQSITYSSSTVNGGTPYVAAKMHDYFTSCLPGPQKSLNPVQIPTSGVLPVKTSDPSLIIGNPSYPVLFQKTNSQDLATPIQTAVVTNTGGNNITTLRFNTSLDSSGYAPVNLFADSTPNTTGSGFLTMSVTDLRLAFQTQKFLEKQARGGSRYREILLSHFGVRSPDARQQVPEYLGGNRIPVQIHQVINQAETASQPLGNLGAYSQTTDVHNDVFKSFTEHGYIYGLCVLRYDHTYSQGSERDWWINDMYDIYWPVFANISEQPVRTKEIYFYRSQSSPTLADDVFGYQEAWADYRYKVNRVCGEMRPAVANGLYSWSFADVYSQAPTLSQSWIKEDPVNVDRALAVTSTTANQFWADFFVKCNTTRPMPLYSIPGLVDHF